MVYQDPRKKRRACQNYANSRGVHLVTGHYMGQCSSLGLVTTKLVFISKRKRKGNSYQIPEEESCAALSKWSLERAASVKQPHREGVRGMNTPKANTRHFEVFPEVILLMSSNCWKCILTKEKAEEENSLTNAFSKQCKNFLVWNRFKVYKSKMIP